MGKTLVLSNLRKEFGVIIVAIKKQSREMIFNPMPTEKLDANDVIVVLGKKEETQQMKAVL
ncbi:MAG: TrkA C-terminal domain-containing protein [Desulfobacterales bacterium]|nr:TrkA C-terminal domain-containing protein [Desulfobacterales bacterium]